MKKQMSDVENIKLVHAKKELDLILSKLGDAWPSGFSPVAHLAHAYGVSTRKVRDCVTLHLRNNCQSARKQRSDAGKTLFNSAQKRANVITPFNHFKKLQRKNHPGELISDAALKTAYNVLDATKKHEMKLGAETERSIAANIVSEVEKALSKTNGSISWERLASYIAGGEGNVQPVSREALRRYVTATEGFHYFVTKTLPQCTTEHTKKWRMRWAIQFHIFWEGAKMVASTVQVVYFHIDEKWFYSLVH